MSEHDKLHVATLDLTTMRCTSDSRPMTDAEKLAMYERRARENPGAAKPGTAWGLVCKERDMTNEDQSDVDEIVQRQNDLSAAIVARLEGSSGGRSRRADCC